MAAPSTAENIVFLAKPEDWEDWNEVLERKAAAAKLLDILDRKNDPLMEPKEPELSTYNRATASTRSTISEPTSIADLNDNDRKNYLEAMKIYEYKQRQFDTQSNGIQGLKDWMEKTVSSTLKKVHFKPREPISAWYAGLRKSVGATGTISMEIAVGKYKKAIKPPSKRTDLSSWISEWENAMTIGTDKKEWFHDLKSALQSSFLESWIRMYAVNQREKIRNKTLDFSEVAMNIREALRSELELGQQPKTRIAKGAFGPTFAGHGDSDEEELEKSKRPTRKRKHSNATQKTCQACGYFHLTERCFYLFPESTPEGWKEKDHIRQQVDQAFKEDATILRDAKRARSKRLKTSKRAEKTEEPSSNPI
ncbi:hypothetical protein ACJ73_06847 [Blastomyces percursus]|uniref:Uncharacterized protein n=1 Tax=Blastomyces percursus TaxID=1658174 RepID=A0A1J9PZQ2_9EURO|nr:hypothetical protein ACJ73_06847 [Blastomyces percursus]